MDQLNIFVELSDQVNIFQNSYEYHQITWICVGLDNQCEDNRGCTVYYQCAYVYSCVCMHDIVYKVYVIIPHLFFLLQLKVVRK